MKSFFNQLYLDIALINEQNKRETLKGNIVKLTHRFSLMMRKGKIQRTQNAPNEPCIFLSRERKKDAKKNMR